jgi:hypothetical protein
MDCADEGIVFRISGKVKTHKADFWSVSSARALIRRVEHWMYPDKAIAVTFDDNGKVVSASALRIWREPLTFWEKVRVWLGRLTSL